MLLSDDVIEKWCFSAMDHMEIQGAGGEGRLPPPPAPQADSGPGRDSRSPALPAF